MDLTTLQQIIIAVISLAGTALTSVAIVGVHRLGDWLGVKRDGELESSLDRLVVQGLNGIEDSAKEAIRNRSDLAIENESVGLVVDWVWRMAPKNLEKLGVDDEWIEDKVRAFARNVL